MTRLVGGDQSPTGAQWAVVFKDRLRTALEVLSSKVLIDAADAPTHRLVQVSGWAGDETAERAIAEYLVGLRMMMVSAALQIQCNLLGAQIDSGPSVKRNVEIIVGATDADLSERQVVQERNPWIAEALWHLCLHLSQKVPSAHPNGSIIAVDYAHSFAKEQGLDLAALYVMDSGMIGLTIVETKAYEAGGTKAVIDAAGLFRSVDREELDVEIRRAVSIMRDALPFESQHAVTGTFWRNERT